MSESEVVTDLSQMPSIDVSMVSQDGFLRQAEDGTWWVWVRGKAVGFSDNSTVIAIPGSEDAKGDVVYVRHFHKKVIYLDVDEAKRAVFGTENTLIIGATGYSSLTDENCAKWQIQPGAYEIASERLIYNLLMYLQSEFPTLKVGIVDGAFPKGIDKALIQASRRVHVKHLGFTCFSYLIHGEDNEDPVYCTSSQPKYSDAFIQALDVLLGMNGRQIAFEHDMLASIKYRKALILVNVIKSISRNGGSTAYNADNKIEDALTAFMESVRMLSRLPSESFNELSQRVAAEIADVTRLIRPHAAFGFADPEFLELEE